MTRDEALAALWDRLNRWNADRASDELLEPAAWQEAQVLYGAFDDPDEDIQACHALGTFHWARWIVRPAEDGDSDLWTAQALLAHVDRRDPYAIPQPARQLLGLDDVDADDFDLRRGPHDGERWNEAAIDRFGRYRDTGDPKHLSTAIELMYRAVDAAPAGHLDRASYTANLGSLLQAHYECSGDPVKLADAVAAARDAVAAAPVDHPNRSGFLSGLGGVLRVAYERSGDRQLLAEAMDAGRRAVASASRSERLGYLSNLGASLLDQYELLGDRAVLAEAVTTLRDAAEAADDNTPGRPGILSNLGSALQLQYEIDHDAAVLDEAVQVGRAAVAAASVVDPDRATYLTVLGVVLRLAYRRYGDLTTLAEAIDVGRAALDATPPGSPSQANALSSLGNALRVQYEHTGDLAALDEAITIQRDAAVATAPGQQYRSLYSSNLSISLRMRYERTGDDTVLAEAVRSADDAVAGTPVGDPNRARYLSTLGNALRLQAERADDRAALARAVEASREAVDASPEGVLHRAGFQSNLGLTLLLAFRQTGNLAALNEATTVLRTAAETADPQDPNRCMYLVNLGAALLFDYEATRHRHALTEARRVLDAAAAEPTASSRVRASGAQEAIAAAMAAGDHAGAVAAAERAIALLPQLAGRSLTQPDRIYVLGELAGLAGLAAAAAVAASRPSRAVELLEQARGILLADAMEGRGDLTELRDTAPDLAEQFTELQARFLILNGDDQQSFPEPGSSTTTASAPGSTLRGLGAARRATAQQWADLLSRIRARDGLSGFLLPPPIEQLQRQAAEGPIIYVYASHWGSGALILRDQSPVEPVALPRLSGRGAADNLRQLEVANRTMTDPDSSRGERRAAQRHIAVLLQWAWDAIAEPILGRLGHSGTPQARQPWPRVWWCPVGELSRLPLHAAGYHADRTGDSVMDRVVSSYTATARTLSFARERRADSAGGPALVVAVPETDGAPPLPGVVQEVDCLARWIPSRLSLVGPQATRAAVLHALASCGVVHFACHGLSDWVRPTDSRLLLHDHARAPLTAGAIAQVRLKNAGLAYLSACSTADTAPASADEAVHIASAFQVAGYAHVVGSLWPVDDETAVRVCDEFYRVITASGVNAPTPSAAAAALHQATHRLRDEHRDRPFHWAGYVHVGT